MELDSHAGCAMSGLTADARTMIDFARVEAQVSFFLKFFPFRSSFLGISHFISSKTIFSSGKKNHWFTYNEKIKIESITQAVCDLALRFGEGHEGKEKTMVKFFCSCHGKKIYNQKYFLESTFWSFVIDRWF